MHKILIVYDGECAFCRRSVAEFRRRDPHDQFVYLPRQTPGLDERYPQLSIGDFETGMRVIEPDGRMHIGSDAIYQIVSRLPYFRRIACMYHLPVFHSLTRRLYGWVARNRMKLSRFCDGDGACKINAEVARGEVSSLTDPPRKLGENQLMISVLILLVIGLHPAANMARAINRSSVLSSRAWPFMAYGMYRQSFSPGPITTTKRHIVGLTAGGEEVEISAATVGLFGSQGFSRFYLGPILGGDLMARQRLADRVNLGREDPVIGLRVETEVYTISDVGIKEQKGESLMFPVRD